MSSPSTNAHRSGTQMGEQKRAALGTVRLRDYHTNEVILIPRPSNDPNDPLKWPQAYKYYIALVVCLAMLICNFLAAGKARSPTDVLYTKVSTNCIEGPTVAIVETALEFFPTLKISKSVARVAYFFTSTSLVQGTGNFLWVPLTNKFGRRPVYIISYAIYFAAALWLVFERHFSRFLIGRILLGFGSGAAETLAPITIAVRCLLSARTRDHYGILHIILVHWRSLGILIDGLIVINNSWRVIYEVASALVALVFLLAFFTFPETAFVRDDQPASIAHAPRKQDTGELDTATQALAPTPKKTSYLQSLKIFHRALTEESLIKMFFRPFGMILLPPVLWAALVQSVVRLPGLACGPRVHLSYPGVADRDPAGGQLGDMVADWLTRRNNGIRTPEMRLPAISISLITTPLSLILYGVGIQNKLHWICPTIGLGLLNFSITQATNICLVYVIDAYRPIAGEITLTVLGFKSLFGFLLSFYTNPWVEKVGYVNAFGTMAAISAGVLLLWIPLYFWGDFLRRRTWQWRLISYIHWTSDREVGE
ncbi:hypothetical protein CIB48_g3117 [Xylaria polymorpha]|nr:hypothetical protein CIB48_g3117 [Xylaria polymorpha]